MCEQQSMPPAKKSKDHAISQLSRHPLTRSPSHSHDVSASTPAQATVSTQQIAPTNVLPHVHCGFLRSRPVLVRTACINHLVTRIRIRICFCGESLLQNKIRMHVRVRVACSSSSCGSSRRWRVRRWTVLGSDPEPEFKVRESMRIRTPCVLFPWSLEL